MQNIVSILALKSWITLDFIPLVINMIIAIIPSVLLCTYVYKRDIIEKEPKVMLLKLFLLGVLITLPAAFMEKSIVSSFDFKTSNVIDNLIMSFAIVALIEEGYKFLITYFSTWNNRNFDHIYDGIVYATFVSLGFASLENILYVLDTGTETALLRAIISVPAHAFYAVACGYFLGLSKFNYSIGNKRLGRLHKFFSFFFPVLLHGIFDFLLLINNSELKWIFFVFVTVLYIISFFNIKRISATEMTSSMQRKE